MRLLTKVDKIFHTLIDAFQLFLGLSLAGTFTHGYFFAFHLLNIVNNNQLLGGVIQAVTQNGKWSFPIKSHSYLHIFHPGKSLLWVAVLGLVIFYLYALVAFAFFRDVFVPSKYLYCSTLWQCTMTMVRYGLLGDYDEVRERFRWS